MFGFIGGLIRMAFLFALWWLLAVFVLLPGVLLAGPVGLVEGAVMGLMLTVRVLGPRSPAPVLTPEQYAARPLPKRRVRMYLRRDLAWPHYFAGQSRLDSVALAQAIGDALGKIWGVPYDRWIRLGVRHPDLRLAVWPAALIVPVFQVAATLGAGVVVVVAFAVTGVIAVVCWAAGIATAVALRTVDRLWRTVFRARGSCPTGFHTFAVPAYRCAGLHTLQEVSEGSDLHRDLRPSRQGVLVRRCACGRLLPTTVVRAAHSQQACCPYCLAVLSRGTGWYTDVRLPFFGATSAGKTNLIMAAAVALHRIAQRNGLWWSLPDDHSRTEFGKYLRSVEQGQNAPKTAGGVPTAVTVTVGRGRRGAMVRFFDAAGETLADRSQNGDLTYLEKSKGLVFVLDPFSIPDIRSRYTTDYADLFAAANAAVDNPQVSYDVTVSRLRDSGISMKQCRLSFVVSKADLLAKLPSRPSGDGEIAAWLGEHLESDLVKRARRDFDEVRFFLATVHNGWTDDAYRIIQWLLKEEGVRT